MPHTQRLKIDVTTARGEIVQEARQAARHTKRAVCRSTEQQRGSTGGADTVAFQ